LILQRLNLEDYYRDLDFKEPTFFRKADAKVALILESTRVSTVFFTTSLLQKSQMTDY
jgi:hypothetical protein